MNNTDRIKHLLEQIHTAEQKLDGLRAELRRLVAEELGYCDSSKRLLDGATHAISALKPNMLLRVARWVRWPWNQRERSSIQRFTSTRSSSQEIIVSK